MPFDIIPFFRAQKQIIGSFVYNRDEVEKVLELAARGLITPLVYKIFPLDQAREAMETMERREHFGKILLKPGAATVKRLGVDVGGTFTDLIYVDDDGGRILVHKLPTTPDDPSQGTMQGIRELTEQAGEAPSALDQVFHGTTIATNIVIEHNGATVGLITTEGYRDILHIARHKKPLNFSNYQDLPWQRYPIVRRRYRLTVPERVLKDGSVLVPLDEERARERVRAAEGGRSRGDRGVLPLLVPQPRARAARGRDRARGVPGGVPLGLVRGAAAVPRVRALLDRVRSTPTSGPRSRATSAGSRSSSRRWTSGRSCT